MPGTSALGKRTPAQRPDDGRYAPVAGYPPLTNPRGLRRWDARLGDAASARADLAVYGDSTVVGIGAAGSDGDLESAVAALSWPRHLARYFTRAGWPDPGEGFILTRDYRVTFTGTQNTDWLYRTDAGPLGSGARVVTSSGALILAVAASTADAVEVCWMWLAGLSNTAITYTWSGGGTGTIPVQSVTGFYKQTITNPNPGTAQTLTFTGTSVFLSWFRLSKNTTTLAGTTAPGASGVQVHRIATSGHTSADLDGTAVGNTSTQQGYCIDSGFTKVAPALAIFAIGTNDYFYQAGGAPKAGRNGITPTAYAANLLKSAQAVIAAGGCVLLCNQPRRPETIVGGTYTEPQYTAAARGLAAANDHIAHVDLADLWGPVTAGHTTDTPLQITNSVHPSRMGYGDWARIVYRVVNDPQRARF